METCSKGQVEWSTFWWLSPVLTHLHRVSCVGRSNDFNVMLSMLPIYCSCTSWSFYSLQDHMKPHGTTPSVLNSTFLNNRFSASVWCIVFSKVNWVDALKSLWLLIQPLSVQQLFFKRNAIHLLSLPTKIPVYSKPWRILWRTCSQGIGPVWSLLDAHLCSMFPST